MVELHGITINYLAIKAASYFYSKLSVVISLCPMLEFQDSS